MRRMPSPNAIEDMHRLTNAVAAYLQAPDDPDSTTFHQLTERDFALIIVGLRHIRAETHDTHLRWSAESLEDKLLDAARAQRGGGDGP